MSSAVDPRNDSENFGAECLNNLNTIKHTPNGYLPLNFIPMKYKELLAYKRWEGLPFNKTVPISTSPFFSLLVCWYVLFLWSICGKCLLSLWWIYGNPSLSVTRRL